MKLSSTQWELVLWLNGQTSRTRKVLFIIWLGQQKIKFYNYYSLENKNLAFQKNNSS